MGRELTLNSPQPPPYGIYTPIVTFFNTDETIDYGSTTRHALRMASSGVTGLVLHGSNGEAPHLLHNERSTLIKTIKQTLLSSGYPSITLIVGCGAPSVRETQLHISAAASAGADYALVLPPSYWVAAMTVPRIESFFSTLATASPLPLIIYNFPAVTAGIDISSDTLIRLARSHPNIVGAKLTCGNVGKLQRVAAAAALPSGSFAAFAGKADFLLPALLAGARGGIAALANLVPKLHVELLRLYDAGDMKGAQKLQAKLSEADWALTKGGVAGVKAVVAHYFGYGSGLARAPMGEGSMKGLTVEERSVLEDVVRMEQEIRE